MRRDYLVYILAALLILIIILLIGIGAFGQLNLIGSKLGLRPVRVTSSISNLTVMLSDEQYLKKKLDEAGFWKKGQPMVINIPGQKPQLIAPSSLNIVFTKEPQQYDALFSGSNKTPYQAYGYTYNKSTQELQMMIYLSPSIVSSLSNDKLATRFSSLILGSIYHFTNHLLLEESNPSSSNIKAAQVNFVKDLLKLNRQSFISISQ